MDFDECLAIDHTGEIYEWAKLIIKCCDENLLFPWISTFHPENLPCSRGINTFGSFNWCEQVVFTNGEKWMVRFPRGGHVHCPDEKVENEVAVMMLLHERTTIPVPKIKAWGLSDQSPLGLGPFIISEFVEGVSLNDVLQQPGVWSRFLKKDMNDRDVDKVYRQICRFQLQIAKLDFARIGGLSPAVGFEGDFAAVIKRRPLPWKLHQIVHDGGVDVFGSPDSTFETASEYLQFLAQADLKHLHEQPNSGDDVEDAADKFRHWKVMSDLVPMMCLPEYERGPFKLICDDFTPANMIVNNAEDLDIVAVFDWEWSYAGPSQLFWTAPKWLMMQSPTKWHQDDWKLAHYKHLLTCYLEVLEQEEAAYGYDGIIEARPSARVKQTMRDGRWWYHFIIMDSFNGPKSCPFRELTKEVEGFDELLSAVPSAEVDQFVAMKKDQMETYKLKLAGKLKTWQGIVYKHYEDKRVADEKEMNESEAYKKLQEQAE